MNFSDLSADEKLDMILNYLYIRRSEDCDFEVMCEELEIRTEDEIYETGLVIEYLLLEDRYIYESEDYKHAYRINFRGKK